MRISMSFLTCAAFALVACGETSEADAPLADEISGSDDEAAPKATAQEAVQEEVVTTQEPQETTRTTPERAVMTGQDGPEFDACGGWGEVSGLNPDGDNFLSVRSRPEAGSTELDRLGPGAGVTMCETAPGFIGIVYRGEGQKDLDCAINSGLEAPEPYTGPCRSGWVSDNYVTLLAG